MGRKVRCLQCNTELQSLSRHDFNECKCNNHLFVDGGNDYFRWGCHFPNLVEIFDEPSKTWISVTDWNFENNL